MQIADYCKMFILWISTLTADFSTSKESGAEMTNMIKRKPTLLFLFFKIDSVKQ